MCKHISVLSVKMSAISASVYNRRHGVIALYIKHRGRRSGNSDYEYRIWPMLTRTKNPTLVAFHLGFCQFFMRLEINIRIFLFVVYILTLEVLSVENCILFSFYNPCSDSYWIFLFLSSWNTKNVLLCIITIYTLHNNSWIQMKWTNNLWNRKCY
jgi:hypothetical protein